MFVETNMSSNVNALGERIEATIAMMRKAIAKEYARRGTEVNFVVVVGAEIGKTLRAKNT